MKRTFPILAFILLIICSCHKEEPSPAPAPKPASAKDTYYYLDTSIIHYKFNVGTYWVFENDTTHMLDSIVVDSISSGFFIFAPNVHGTTGTTYNEYYEMYIHDFGASKYYNESLITKSIIRNFGGDYSHFYGQTIFMANSSIGTTNYGMGIIAKFPSMNINTNNFNNVDEVKITAANQYQQEFTYDTYLYYTDTVGLVKKETLITPTNLESWSIKRWHVIK